MVMALGLTAAAQGIRVEAPNLVASDEQFNISFIVEGENAPSDFQWSPGDDFQLVWGPQKGTSTSVSIVNGKRSKSSRTSFTYVLMPKRTGTFTLPAASATLKGDRISSPAVRIEVASGGRSQAQAPSGQQSSGTQKPRQSGEISSEDIFMRLTLSKTSVVVGEGIEAVLKLYQRVNVAGFEDAKFPGFNGFWSNVTQSPNNIEFRRESIGGEIFNTAVLRAWNLIPQKQGDMVIEPAELVCLINVRKPSQSTGSIFDSFFQDDYRTVRKRVSTPEMVVHVKGLPAGAPASFGGGVGVFRMNASLSKDSLYTHDAASLKITVSGNGNLALLEAPKISFPPDFEVYDVKVSDAAGAKVFEYPFIPRSHGDFVIGPIEYSYYDVKGGRYVVLSSKELPLKVLKGKGQAAVQDAAPAGTVIRKDVRDLGSDIRYIGTTLPAFAAPGKFFFASGAYWAVLALILIAAAAVYLFIRIRAARRADVAGSRSRSAVKLARKRLAAAGEYLKKDLYTAFYEELHRTLLGFVSDRLQMDSSEMSRENIVAELLASGVDEKAAGQFTSLLEACEFARYAPASGHEAMDAHYKAALDVMSVISSDMKKKNKSVSGAALALILSLILPLQASAADNYLDSLWNSGVAAYSQGQWKAAEQNWKGIADAGLTSPVLCCNLGDAFFKDGDYPSAILWYERALKLDPSYKDARFNLDLAAAQVQDRIDSVPEFFLVGWARSFCYLLSSDAWAVLSCILLALALAALLIFLLSQGSGARKAGFFSALILALLFLLAVSAAGWQKSEFERADEAIVMKPVVPVKSAPSRGDSKDLFILHEGTKVRIIDSVGDWNNVSLSDGRQGWMPSETLEII